MWTAAQDYVCILTLKEEVMGRKKPIVLVSIIFILYLAVIFSSAEQDEVRITTNRSFKDTFSIKDYFLPEQRYVTGEMIVKFKRPLSDFELDNLFDEYQPQKLGYWPSSKRIADNLYLIRFPENYSVEQMVQVFERSPYVKYAEPNHIYHLVTGMPNEPSAYFLKKLHTITRKRIKEVLRKGLHTDIEKTPRAGGERRSHEALKKEDILPKDIHGETNLVLDAYKASQEAVKKYNGIPPYPETDNYTRKIQSSDNKLIIRSKAKIYKYRNSEGRLVITNYYLDKSNARNQ